MQTAIFDFQLPKELIAQYPLPQRSASKLMCLDLATATIAHRNFTDLIKLLSANDLLVFNNTRVIPARLFAKKKTGGNVEILVERILSEHKILVQLGSNKPIKIGSELSLANSLSAKVIAKHHSFFELEINEAPHVLAVIKQLGHVPLPPYIERSDIPLDQERYQTIFAKQDGAVAAPTASLHFDQELLAALTNKGIDSAFLTLHVGAGTFQPVRVTDIAQHTMHAEYSEISPATCEKINLARKQGKRIIAVGTTVVRALETAAQNGKLSPFAGETNIFIYPGYQFRCVDGLITNFHLPKSTLLMLVCAFAGYDNTMRAYHEAVAQKYRFFSYGDAMIIKKF